MFIFGAAAVAQSTDAQRPTPITMNVLSGTVRGSGTHYYSLRARTNTLVTVRARLSAPGLKGGEVAFSLDFRGTAGADGGATSCCEGESYLPLSSAESNTVNLETSFRTTTGSSFLMMLNFSTSSSSPLTYEITFEGLDSEVGADLGLAGKIIPQTIKSRTITGSVNRPLGDDAEVLYSIEARKGYLTIDFSALARDGMNIVLGVEGSGVFESIGPLISGGNDRMKGRVTFKVPGRQTLQISVRGSGRAGYTINFSGSALLTGGGR